MRHDNSIKNIDLVPLLHDLRSLNIDQTISYIVNDECRGIDLKFYNLNYKEVYLEALSGKISSIHTNIYEKINSTKDDEQLTWRKYHALFKKEFVEEYALDWCHLQTIGTIERDFTKTLHTKCHRQIPFSKYPKYYIELKKKKSTLSVNDEICNLNNYIKIYEGLHKEINDKFKMNPKFNLDKIYNEFYHKFTDCQTFSKDHIQRADQYRGENMKIQKKYLNCILHFGIRCQICKLFIQEINSKNIIGINNVTNILSRIEQIIKRFKNRYIDYVNPSKPINPSESIDDKQVSKKKKKKEVFKRARGCKLKNQDGFLSQTSSDSTSTYSALDDIDEFSDEEKYQTDIVFEETKISFEDWKNDFEKKLEKHCFSILIENDCDFSTFLNDYHSKFNLEYWLKNIYEDINFENSDNETFLIYIIKNNLLPLMKVILEYDSLDINKITGEQKNALYYAIELNRQFFVKLLLNNEKINVKNNRNIKMPYLELSISKNNYLITVELLKNEDININYGKHEYPLIYALENNTHLLQLLLENPSIDININSKISRRSFIEKCFFLKSFEIIKYIILNKKIINKYAFMNLLIDLENHELVNIFIDNIKDFKINTKDSNGDTILIRAVVKNLQLCVNKILTVYSDNIDISIKNKQNKTALDIAIEDNNTYITELLNK